MDAQRTYREITILPQLDHDNIVKLQEVIRARNGKDIYLVFEFVETDLHSVLGYLFKLFSEKILQETHIRFITYQLCKVMKYLHSAQVIHRDMKSSNILINPSCESNHFVRQSKYAILGSCAASSERRMRNWCCRRTSLPGGIDRLRCFSARRITGSLRICGALGVSLRSWSEENLSFRGVLLCIN